MGKVVKHVTSALTGHKGDSKQTTKSTETNNQTQSSSNWLADEYKSRGIVSSVMNEANNYNYIPEQLAGSNANLDQGLAGLAAGVDTSVYSRARDAMLASGQGDVNAGRAGLQGAQGVMSQLMNQSQEDYDAGIKKEFNSDLVNDRKTELTNDMYEAYDAAVQGLNQRASTAGAMGSSRAGVAQGVMFGKNQLNLSKGINEINQQEETLAANRYQNFMANRLNSATGAASSYQGLMNTGNTEYNQGMTYADKFNSAVTQNYQNQFTAGQYQRSIEQEQLNINRQNQEQAQTPALNRLMKMNQGLAPMASWSQVGNVNGTSNGTNVTTTPGQGGNLLGGLLQTGMSAAGSYMGMGSTGSGIMGMFGGAFGNTYGR